VYEGSCDRCARRASRTARRRLRRGLRERRRRAARAGGLDRGREGRSHARGAPRRDRRAHRLRRQGHQRRAHRAIELFNERYADQGLKAEKLELEEGADEVRQQFIQRAQAKSADCDVLQADIIWIAEFAQQKWLLDMTDYVSTRQDEFIPSTLAPFRYDGKFWGVPQVTGAGMLYRRTDQVPDVPASWQELYRVAAENNGIAYQGAPYEGLTCNFVELSSAAAGGSCPRTAPGPTSTARRTSRR
jgi:Bacterial extracellular solute-binding protein